ncbi:MAG: hypothetical protein HY786_07350 [Deltaproteobacteria bacterium]|nr:hypothetical protein [Deltaproteobacteria bacterium]
MIRPVYIVMLLFSVATAIYYPSILEIFLKPNIFNIDDANLMDFILNNELFCP